MRSCCLIAFIPVKIGVAFRAAMALTCPGFTKTLFALVALPLVVKRVVRRTARTGCFIVTAPFLALPALPVKIIRETVLAALATTGGIL
jgi:hypothetical protein